MRMARRWHAAPAAVGPFLGALGRANVRHGDRIHESGASVPPPGLLRERTKDDQRMTIRNCNTARKLLELMEAAGGR
jgi:hypothetical protein